MDARRAPDTAGVPQTLGVVDLVAQFETRLVRLNYSPKTTRDYIRTAQRFLAVYPGVAPELYSADHVEHFLSTFHVSPRTYCTRLGDLKAFFEHLRRHEKLIRVNPCADVEKPRWQPNRRHATTREEFDRIRDACRHPQEVLIVEILYFTGIRLAELLALRWQDLDLEKRRLEVLHGKGNKFRIVPFPPHVQTLLEGSRSLPGAPVVASRQTPTRAMAPSSVQQATLRIGRRAGLRYDLTPHVLRHGFALLCKKAGLRTETTARLMGHADTRPVVSIYGWLEADDLQDEYDLKVPS